VKIPIADIDAGFREKIENDSASAGKNRHSQGQQPPAQEVASAAGNLDKNWPALQSGGKRQTVEAIAEKIVVGKGEITINLCYLPALKNWTKVAEGVGFEPTVALRLRLISSQVPSTTQPPFQPCRE
jgi:hypothetical protein